MRRSGHGRASSEWCANLQLSDNGLLRRRHQQPRQHGYLQRLDRQTGNLQVSQPGINFHLMSVLFRYHIYPKCLERCSFGTRSDILGVALDGFPIYGPIDDDGAQLTSKVQTQKIFFF